MPWANVTATLVAAAVIGSMLVKAIVTGKPRGTTIGVVAIVTLAALASFLLRDRATKQVPRTESASERAFRTATAEEFTDCDFGALSFLLTNATIRTRQFNAMMKRCIDAIPHGTRDYCNHFHGRNTSTVIYGALGECPASPRYNCDRIVSFATGYCHDR